MLSTSQRAPGIAVPVPGAADAVARLEDARREPELAQAVEHVEPGEPGPDDDRVDVGHAQTVAGWNSSVLPSGSLHSICVRPPGWTFSWYLMPSRSRVAFIAS